MLATLFQVTDTFVVPVDAEPEAVREAASVVGIRQTLDLPSYVKVIWDVRVRPAGAGGSFLSVAARCVATDDAMRERLLIGWGVVGPLVESLAGRRLAAVKACLEEHRVEPRERFSARALATA